MSNGGSYDPRSIEPEIYKFWEEGGYFHAEPDTNPDPARRRKPYVIDIPLPNVTGSLHLGHALNNTIQDVLIRYKRMCGFNAMWMPGMDHAGIATQAVVEKKLFEETGKTRHDLKREGLVKKIWEWKEQYGGRILQQLRRIGCSCDWARERFTLDDVCAKAVYEAFFRLFKDGLIYRGLRLVNWDAHLQTAVADDEIVHETVQGHLWHYRYPIVAADPRVGRSDVAADPRVGRSDALDPVALAAIIQNAARPDAKPGVDYLVVATTRPETMLGDTAVAVHPEDERYKPLIGKNCLLPLANRPIPIIGDGLLVKKEFGTGCVKVTPGHDPNDYACGQRNGLQQINILTVDGRLNENGGKYAGLTVHEARKKVVADLEALGLMEKVEPYQHEVGHSDRSKTPIEPMLSEQWFVKMTDLCEIAMEAVRDGRVKFFPERYANTYLDWLGEKRDWCISRQLWWGHRIPVWQVTLNAKKYEKQENSLQKCLERIIPEFQSALKSYAQACGVQDDIVTKQSEKSDTIFHICARTHHACEAFERFYARHHTARHVGPFEPDPPIEPYLEQSDPRFVPDAELWSTIAILNKRDEDVLDTWFSSALWPFSTLYWPDPNPDLDYFYPTSTLVTAREIITLWVARMVMTSLYFNNVVPFEHVHIHANIQDGTGRRMSKSAGNGVDPVDLIELYGADAMRFTLAQMSTETQDIRMPVAYLCPHCGGLTPQESVVPKNKVPSQIHKVNCQQCKKPFATIWASADLKQELGTARDTSDKFEIGRNLANKLWQAATGFVFPNIDVAADPRVGRNDVAADPRVGRSDVAADPRVGRSDVAADPRVGRSDVAADPRVGRSDVAADPRVGRCQSEHEAPASDTVVRSSSFAPNPGGPQSSSFAYRPLAPADLAIEDLWILARLAACIEEVDRRFAKYQLNEVANALYAFFWSDFCDWYVELVKPRLSSRDAAGVITRHDDASANAARQVLAWVLDQTLRLMHPIMPFVTEELWRRLNAIAPLRGLSKIEKQSDALIVARWPDAASLPREAGVEDEMRTLQSVIRAVRDIRTHVNVIRSTSKEKALRTLPRSVVKADDKTAAMLKHRLPMLQRLGQCDAFEIGPDLTRPADSMSTVLAAGLEVYVPIAGLADLAVERRRLSKERDELAGHIARLEGKLGNEGFVAKAPPDVIARERARLAELKEKLAAVERNLSEVSA